MNKNINQGCLFKEIVSKHKPEPSEGVTHENIQGKRFQVEKTERAKTEIEPKRGVRGIGGNAHVAGKEGVRPGVEGDEFGEVGRGQIS